MTWRIVSPPLREERTVTPSCPPPPLWSWPIGNFPYNFNLNIATAFVRGSLGKERDLLEKARLR